MANAVWECEGWMPDGPRFCRCPGCNKRVSTNAYARRAHAKSCPEYNAKERIRAVPRRPS